MRNPLPLTLAAAVLLLAGCGGDQPGDPAVYERIDGLTDCAALQQEFDTAAGNNGRAEPGSELHEATAAYMEAADERLRELDCY